MVIIPPLLTRLAGGFGLWKALRLQPFRPVSDSPRRPCGRVWFPDFPTENSARIQLLTRLNDSLQSFSSKAVKQMKRNEKTSKHAIPGPGISRAFILLHYPSVSWFYRVLDVICDKKFRKILCFKFRLSAAYSPSASLRPVHNKTVIRVKAVSAIKGMVMKPKRLI